MLLIYVFYFIVNIIVRFFNYEEGSSNEMLVDNWYSDDK